MPLEDVTKGPLCPPPEDRLAEADRLLHGDRTVPLTFVAFDVLELACPKSGPTRGLSLAGEEMAASDRPAPLRLTGAHCASLGNGRVELPRAGHASEFLLAPLPEAQPRPGYEIPHGP